MNSFLKEASEYDKQSVVNSKFDATDLGPNLFGPMKNKLADNRKPFKCQLKPIPKKMPEVKLEPLGEFNNPYGKPQVAHDDPYLSDFVNDLFLRQNEYKK